MGMLYINVNLKEIKYTLHDESNRERLKKFQDIQ